MNSKPHYTKEEVEEIAYHVMYNFLSDYYKRGQSDEIGILLGGLNLLEDGRSADPALSNDWHESFLQVIDSGQTDIKLNLKK